MSVVLNASANQMIIVSNVLEVQFQNKNSTREQVFIMIFFYFSAKETLVHHNIHQEICQINLRIIGFKYGNIMQELWGIKVNFTSLSCIFFPVDLTLGFFS